MTEDNHKPDPAERDPNHKYDTAWKQRQKAKGKRRVEMYLKTDTFESLKAVRNEQGCTYGAIVEPLILEYLESALGVAPVGRGQGATGTRIEG